MYGELGTVNSISNQEVTVYHFNTDNMEVCTCNINIVNTSNTDCDLILAITSGGQIDKIDYYDYHTLEPSGTLERTGIVMSLGEKIIIKSSNDKCVARVHGFEENVSELTNPDDNNPPSLSTLQHNVPTDVIADTTYNITFWGATDPDGDSIVAKIDNITPVGGISFSKVDNIKVDINRQGSDTIQLFVHNPSIIKVARFRLVLLDKKGGSSYRYFTMNITGVGN